MKLCRHVGEANYGCGHRSEGSHDPTICKVSDHMYLQDSYVNAHTVIQIYSTSVPRETCIPP